MEQKPITSLIENIPNEVEKLYITNKPIFIKFAQRYTLSDTELGDIYQEAFIILREHAISGHLDSISSSMRTYLFGIGKKLIFKELQRQRKERTYFEVLKNEKDIPSIEFEIDEPLSEEQKHLYSHFKILGEKCQEMLRLYFYRGLTVKEIMVKRGYESENVVSSTKSRCLKKLKQMINPEK